MSSPVGAHAPAGDPVFRRSRRLPGCSFGTLDAVPVARFDHRTADDRDLGCPWPRPPSVRPRRPGCPVRRSRTSMPLPPTPSARFPVRRPLRPRPPVRPPRLPGSSSPAPHRLPREGSSARIRIILHQPRFHLVNPVGPSIPLGPLAGSPASSTPFLGFRLACADRYEAHSARAVSAGQQGFSVHTGLSTELVVHPQNFFVRPLFTHRLCTAERLTRGSFAG